MAQSPWGAGAGSSGAPSGPGASGSDGLIVTTTHSVEGRPVLHYLGLVTGEVIVGANLFRDIFASVRDLVGGRSASYEEVLGRAREQALSEMQMSATQRGANAIVGVDIDYEVLGKAGSMLMVSVSGTAVII